MRTDRGAMIFMAIVLWRHIRHMPLLGAVAVTPCRWQGCSACWVSAMNDTDPGLAAGGGGHHGSAISWLLSCGSTNALKCCPARNRVTHSRTLSLFRHMIIVSGRGACPPSVLIMPVWDYLDTSPSPWLACGTVHFGGSICARRRHGRRRQSNSPRTGMMENRRRHAPRPLTIIILSERGTAFDCEYSVPRGGALQGVCTAADSATMEIALP